MANTKLQIAIEASNNATSQLRSLESDLKGVSSAAGGSSMGFGRLVGAIGLGNIAANAASSAFHAFGSFLEGTISAAEEAEATQAQLAAVLKSTGEVAGVTAQMANDLASQMSELTTFSRDQVVAGENLMLTFTKVSKDVFPEAIKAALNVSTAMGSDLHSSIVQLGKALNNPAQGLTALTRIGVSFTEQQKEQIQTLEESGKTMEAQKLILAELSKEFGGSAEAAANTYQGKIKQLDNSLHEIQENIGKAVLPALDLFVNDAVSAAKSAQSATAKNDTWARSFYSLASGAKTAGYVLEGVAFAILTLGTLLVGGAAEAVAFATDVVKSFQRVGAIGKDVFSALTKALSGDFAGAKTEMAKAFNEFDMSGFHSTVQAVNKTIGTFAGDMENAFSKAGQAMKEGVVQNGFKSIQDAAPVVKQQLEDSLGGGSSKGAQKASEALQKISDQAKETQSKLSDVIDSYTQKASDQLDAYNQKMADITGKMSQLQDDYAKSQTDKEKQYQDERLHLFMEHQDKVAQLTKDLQNEQKRMQETGTDDQGQAKLAEIQKQIDAENLIVQQNNDLKAAADVLRTKNDLQLLAEKHQAELKTDQEAFDKKMTELRQEMQKEQEEHKKQTERLKQETIKRFDTLLSEYQKGYEKLISESKLKHAELLSIESQVEATVRAIQSAESALKSAPSGTAPILPQTHLASGGIVTRPTVALIGESGPEAVVPLRGNNSPLSQPISVSIMEGAVVNVSNQADETRLARTVAKELAKVLQGNRFGLAAQM